MDWEYLFSPIMLERGYDYFTYGHVSSLKQIDIGYKAIVSGTDDYTVLIYCEEDDISDMECTCPYAEDNDKCKHMAAVLYAIENQEDIYGDSSPDDDSYTGKTLSDSEMIREIVNGMDFEDLRRELIAVLVNDENLGAGFIMRYTRSKNSISHYINNLTQTARIIFRQCSDKDGFVDWRNASTLTSRLIDEVINELRDFAAGDAEVGKAAFDISLYVLDLFANTDFDDDGQTQDFIETCFELWENILSNTNNNDLPKYMLDKLIIQSDKIGIGEYIAEEIDSFISEQFNEDGFTATKLEMLDARIERYENDTSWIGGYNLSNSIMERLRIMEETGSPPGEIENFRDRFWHLPAMREDLMMEFESAGKTEELVTLLKKSIEIDRGLPGLVSKYSRKLIACYKKTGETDNLKEELFTYITVYSNGDTNAFSELKQCCSDEEWVLIREKIFTCLLNKRADIKPLLAFEGLTARLFELLSSEVNKSRGLAKIMITVIDKYESSLRPDYDEEFLDMYETLIRSMAEYAGGRSHYKDIVVSVRKMLKLPGGKERAVKLLENWRTMFSNRPAMQDELRILYRELEERE